MSSLTLKEQIERLRQKLNQASSQEERLKLSKRLDKLIMKFLENR